MKVKVWGARGSIPAPGPEMNRYGGNTSCVELELSDGSSRTFLEDGDEVVLRGEPLGEVRGRIEPAREGR